MCKNIFLDPEPAKGFHELIRGSGTAVHNDYLALCGETLSNGVSYQHFMTQLNHGTFPLGRLHRLCEAMQLNNVDPEPALMSLFAGCMPHEQSNGEINDEFCAVVSDLGKIAETVRGGTKLSDMAKQDSRGLLLIIGRVAATSRRMAQEVLCAIEKVAA